MRSNDTLVDTPFQLISGFFHVNQGVLCCEHAEQASSWGVLGGGGRGGATGLLNKGGGLPGLLVTKQQAVEFPQVLTKCDCGCTHSAYYRFYVKSKGATID